MARQDWLICGGLVVLAILVFLSFRPWALAAIGDVAIFQLFGRLIADGQVPYRDFFDHKTPLTGYANALPALFSKLFGTDLIISTRVLSLAVATAAAVGLYLLSRAAQFSRAASVAVAGTYLAFDFASLLVAYGLEAKALATYAGIFAMLAAYRSRWAVSGAFGSLAFLAWQPGGVFLIAAAARAVARKEEDISASLLRLVAGFVVPAGLLVAYLAAAGAFDEFWRDTITFNQGYVDRQFEWVPQIGNIADRIRIGYASERWIFLLAAVGAGLWMLLGLYGLRKNVVPDAVAQAAPVAVISLFILLYSYVNFTSEVDIIPFLPWIAFWAGWLLDRVTRQRYVPAEALAVLCAAALLVYGHHGLWDRLPDLRNEGGRSAEQAIVNDIEERAGLVDGDKIYAIGQPWFLLASGRDHVAAPYYYPWSGVLDMVREREGFYEALIRPILDSRPKLVVLGPQTGGWLLPWERSEIQRVYAETLLLNYDRVPPAPRGSRITVSRAADYWILTTDENRVDFTERMHSAATLPAFIGGWSADDMRPLAGSPELVRQPASGVFRETSAWALAGRSGVEAIGGVVMRIPDDINPKDRKLYVEVIVALAEDGGTADRIALELQLERATPANAEQGGEPRETFAARGARDVSNRSSGDLAIVTLVASFDALPGEQVVLTIERDGGDPRDTYQHDLRVLGLTVSYRPIRTP